MSFIFACMAPLIVVASGVSDWGSKPDLAALKRAHVVCKEVYSGCVKSIEKRDEQDYHVLCERNKNERNNL